MSLEVSGPLVAMREWLNDENKECTTYVQASAQPVEEWSEHVDQEGEHWPALCVEFELSNNAGSYSEEYLIRDYQEADITLTAINKVRQALSLIEQEVIKYQLVMRDTCNADGRWTKPE